MRSHKSFLTGRLKGDQVKWIDIAAGNLMRNSDQKRQVVVATRND